MIFHVRITIHRKQKYLFAGSSLFVKIAKTKIIVDRKTSGRVA